MNKTMQLADMVSEVRSGDRVSFGGGPMTRKPMVAAIALGGSTVEDLHLSCFLAGPEADLLIGLGKVASIECAHFAFDVLGLAPNFRRAREAGGLDAIEHTEGNFVMGAEAGAHGVPFAPSRSGLATDVIRLDNTPYREFSCPLTGERMIAVPAIRPDVHFIQASLADRQGNVVIHGDPYCDALLARGSRTVFVTVDRIVDVLPQTLSQRDTVISRVWVKGVAEVVRGCGFTACFPDWPIHYRAAHEYQRHATDPQWLAEFVHASNVGFATRPSSDRHP